MTRITDTRGDLKGDRPACRWCGSRAHILEQTCIVDMRSDLQAESSGWLFKSSLAGAGAHSLLKQSSVSLDQIFSDVISQSRAFALPKNRVRLEWNSNRSVEWDSNDVDIKSIASWITSNRNYNHRIRFWCCSDSCHYVRFIGFHSLDDSTNSQTQCTQSCKAYWTLNIEL